VSLAMSVSEFARIPGADREDPTTWPVFGPTAQRRAAGVGL
jgi:hypothetical protein